MENCDYSSQRPWSDQFLPQDKKILSNVFGCDTALIEITTPDVDMRKAADLIIQSHVPDERGVYVAVRTRTAGYAAQYADEFTVRAHYTAGHKTEYAKIMEGYGDIMLYGFVVENVISRWILIDLDVFREEAENDYIKMEHKHNRDGKNSFYAYNIKSFKQPGILLGNSVGYFD